LFPYCSEKTKNHQWRGTIIAIWAKHKMIFTIYRENSFFKTGIRIDIVMDIIEIPIETYHQLEVIL